MQTVKRIQKRQFNICYNIPCTDLEICTGNFFILFDIKTRKSLTVNLVYTLLYKWEKGSIYNMCIYFRGRNVIYVVFIA